MADEIKQLLDMVVNLKQTMEKRFDEMEKRFDKMERRFDKVDDKFAEVDRKFETVFSRLDVLEANQKRIINSFKVMYSDVQNNKKHIEKLENEDDFLPANEI